MGQIVIVVSFPEPENDMEIAKIIRNVKAPFVSRADVKVHMARNETAAEIIGYFDPLHEHENNGSGHPSQEARHHNVFDDKEKD